MILIADSGSSKTDWTIIDEKQTVGTVETPGINPYFQNAVEIEEKLAVAFSKDLKTSVTSIFFYGAGCIKNSTDKTIIQALNKIFINAGIEAEDDLLGAARALLGKEQGIACILGTGSNSCFYNGTMIIDKVPALGYVLGDEGSGSYLGKLFLNSYLKRGMPVDLSKLVEQELNMQMTEVLAAVYRKEYPNRYLAGFSQFILKNIEHPFLKAMVSDSFEAFFSKNIEKYEHYREVPVNFIGSIAYYYSDLLKSIAAKRGIHIEKILHKPIDGLVKYHLE